jgi:hypothetical protein
MISDKIDFRIFLHLSAVSGPACPPHEGPFCRSQVEAPSPQRELGFSEGQLTPPISHGCGQGSPAVASGAFSLGAPKLSSAWVPDLGRLFLYL